MMINKDNIKVEIIEILTVEDILEDMNYVEQKREDEGYLMEIGNVYIKEYFGDFEIIDKETWESLGYIDYSTYNKLIKDDVKSIRYFGEYVLIRLKKEENIKEDVNRTYLHKYVIGTEEELQGLVVDHINGDRKDNRRDNLQIVTYKENINGYNTRFIDDKTGLKIRITEEGKLEPTINLYKYGYTEKEQEYTAEGINKILKYLKKNSKFDSLCSSYILKKLKGHDFMSEENKLQKHTVKLLNVVIEHIRNTHKF